MKLLKSAALGLAFSVLAAGAAMAADKMDCCCKDKDGKMACCDKKAETAPNAPAPAPQHQR